MEKSLLQIAFELVESRKEGVSFKEIWAHVVKEAGLDEETAAKKVSRFFTNLMLDGRFVNLGDNVWDLRSRHTYEEAHIDMSSAYSDVEVIEEDVEDTEQKEYEAVYGDVAPEESEKDTLLEITEDEA